MSDIQTNMDPNKASLYQLENFGSSLKQLIMTQTKGAQLDQYPFNNIYII